MDLSQAKAKIDEANHRLKVAQLPVALKLRGQRISLVATLPPKPGSTKVRDHQQAIALGVPASKLGIQRAEREAKVVGVLLIDGSFSWDRYLQSAASSETTEALVARFERHHRRRHQISDYTWRQHYLYYYGYLPQDEPLSLEAVMPAVLGKPDHTRARQQMCRQLQKLCDFGGLDVDLLQYQGRYSSQTASPRQIPSDEAIATKWQEIRNVEWRWVYGMMATFGLRDHECWYCEFADDDLLVKKGKTGSRLIELPLYSEWVEQWDLKTIKRPKLNLAKGNQYLATQCSQAFRRANVGWSPYNLRYAYGHRGTVLFRYEPGIMARMMGHSVDTHNRTYQRFLNKDLVRRKVVEMKARKGLPPAPSVSGQ